MFHIIDGRANPYEWELDDLRVIEVFAYLRPPATIHGPSIDFPVCLGAAPLSRCTTSTHAPTTSFISRFPTS